MHESHKINFCKTLLLVLYISLITGFFFNENSSGGSKIDFLYTLPFVKKISEIFFLGVELLNKSSTIVNLPLHYIIVALFFKLFESTEILRIIFLNISILIPFIFYKSLGIIYKNLNNLILILILFSIFNYKVVYQKYFDPLFLIIFFTLFKHSAIYSLIKTTSNFRNFLYIFIYFFLYWLVNIVHHTN